MPGLVPGIHVLLHFRKPWMAGTSPTMTILPGASARLAERALNPYITNHKRRIGAGPLI